MSKILHNDFTYFRDNISSLCRSLMGFPGLASGKKPVNAEDTSLIPGLGRSPGGGHGIPLQCSCLENPMDRGA